MTDSPKPSPPMENVARWGADILGAACLLNALAEGVSQGRWHSYTDIYQLYYYVLSAYAALLTSAERNGDEVFYWRDRQDEIDFVLRRGEEIIGIEVKSGGASKALGGAERFKCRYPLSRIVIIGGEKYPGNFEYLPLDDFFAGNVV